MAYTHKLSSSLQTPGGVLSPTLQSEFSGDEIWQASEAVNAYGGGSTTLTFAFSGANLKSLGLLSTVPCVVSFTGGTPSSTTLVANTLTHITTMTGSVTAIVIGANTDAAGEAGTIEVALLYNA